MFRVLLCFIVLECVSGTVYFSEDFPTSECALSEGDFSEDSLENWVKSTHHNEETRGIWSISSSKAWAADGNLGLKTDTDARFYAISAKLKEPFTNRGKTLVIQFSVKYEQTVSCGGAYIKLLRSDIDQTKFHGDTPYLFMFGPDICGYSTKRVHAIFNYNGQNHLIKKDVQCKDDLFSHLYTFILTPDNKYRILIDNEVVEKGNLEDDWDMLPPKKIDDPQAKKPDDWVDEEEIVDPDDKKPEDWDKPEKIPDPDAKKPEDWDDEMDGEWERPQITNPEYKGEWTPKKIPNPAYKGPWVAPQIDNPDYAPNDELYVLEDVAHVGFDLWQVTSGSIFDDILITDDPAFAKAEGERVWKVRHNAETEFNKKEEEEKAEKEKESVEDSEEKDVSGSEDEDKEKEEKEETPESKESSDTTHEEL
ncbi:hypothetical protein AHF37_01960 [Paragonimus kellicotti]|nr:hypothetical protein AHF37_01960 [Paragonimus kellicotti]